MYPTTVEQNRQESLHPQTVHLHMHQLCTCVHPYYQGYRHPPLLASPFPVQPIPRPYNLQHYQYTQFNVSPYSFPLSQMTQPSTPVSSNLERRPNDSGEGIGENIASTSKDSRDLLVSVGGLAETLQYQDVLPPPNENFTRFLEQGCVLAEKIAIRNQHRPCFKNIQNLCNRTRGEILKPSNTVSNIHSQGIPWATKDFIYAFVRLINCWHMLKGYLDSKDGTLGNIDKELTPDFKACYLAWEKDTKELSAHMVRIFSNLDNHVSNPSPSGGYMLRTSKVLVQGNPPKIPQPQIVTTKEAPKLVRGIIHLPQPQTEVVETVIFSESPVTSPREDDSDNESRVYMKPGSYSVPKKANSSDNSSPSIEFFDTAQNVSAHYKKLAKKKTDSIHQNTEKLWQDAQTAVPYLLNKINPQNHETPMVYEEDDALKYFIDLNSLDQGTNIQEWLNNSNFMDNPSCDLNESQPTSPTSYQDSFLSKTVTLLQRNHQQKESTGGDLLANTIKGYKLANLPPSSVGYVDAAFSPCAELALAGLNKLSNAWENEKGGLAANTYLLLEKITKTLECHDLVKHFPKKSSKFQDEIDLRNPLNLEIINKKLLTRKYQFLNEFVHDFRHIFTTAECYYDDEIMPKVKDFAEKFEEELDKYFPSVDFSSITGDRNEDITYLVLKRARKDGDGDH